MTTYGYSITDSNNPDNEIDCGWHNADDEDSARETLSSGRSGVTVTLWQVPNGWDLYHDSDRPQAYPDWTHGWHCEPSDYEGDVEFASGVETIPEAIAAAEAWIDQQAAE